MTVKFSLDDGFCKGPIKSQVVENVILIDDSFSIAYGCNMLCIISKREDGEHEKRLFPSALVSSLRVTDEQWEKETTGSIYDVNRR